MNRFIKGCLTAASGLCALGLVLVILGGIFGGFRQTRAMALNGNLSYPGIVEASNTQIANTETADAEEMAAAEIPNGYYEDDSVAPKAEVEDLSVSIGTCELSICEWDGTDYKITAKNTPGLQCYVQDGTLYLRGAREFYIPGEKHIVTLYVPKDTSFRHAEIELGAGNGNVTALTAETLDVGLGAGNITFADCQVQDIKLDIGAGSAAFAGTISGDADVSCAMGNVALSLDNDLEAFNYRVSMAAGQISIAQNGSYREFNGIADQRIDNDAEQEMNLDCSMGSISVR